MEQPVDQNKANQLSNSFPSEPTRVVKTNDPVAMERTVTAMQSTANQRTSNQDVKQSSLFKT